MADKKRRTGSNPLNSFLSHIPDYTEKEDDSEQSKTKSKTKTESKPKSKTESEAKSKPETKSKAKTKPESETKTQTKANTETKSQSESQPKTESELKANTISKQEPIAVTETIAEPQTFPQAKTFASDIKERAAAQSEQQRFEENHKRQTYWLDHKTIAMISELAERSGRNKYHVVSAGVQMLYEYVFEKTEDEEPQ